MPTKLYLQHSGTPHEGNIPHSGRYPWGSGENPNQHGFDFYYEVDRLRKETGKSHDEIYQMLGYKTTEGRDKYRAQMNAKKAADRAAAIRMRYDQRRSVSAIADILGINEKTVRRYLDDSEKVKEDKVTNTANMLKEALQEYPYLDIGEGVEKKLGISKEQLRSAYTYLEQEEGYVVSKIQVNQINSRLKGQKTTMLVLGPPGKSEHDQSLDVYDHLEDVHYIGEYYSEDGGLTFGHMLPPVSLDSKRLEIKYADENGFQPKDGVIEIRPGVEDLSLGPNQVYSQVRIAVDDKYYLKGMAIYSNDLPPGIDVRFNTNKMEGAPPEKVFKLLKRTKTLENGDPDPNSPIDKDNPFGANIAPIEKGGQRLYTDANGVKQQSIINKVNPEGTWETWDRNLASQFLSKQPKELAQNQLNLQYLKQVEDFESIKSITNNMVRKKELEDFADSCDEASADLKAWAMPRQSTKVLLPLQSLKETECYCPDYKNGEKLCLVRYPHSGPTEILQVTVNNNNKDGQNLFGKTPRDVIAINPKSAAKLSGADFDGDSVVVIPNNKGQIKVKEQLFTDFDPKMAYPWHDDLTYKPMNHTQHGKEMGKAANLITDMSIKGCDDEQLARAIKYSMVVVDAEKHKLDWHQAIEDFGIKQLRKEYQDKSDGGASTLLSRAKGPEYVEERRLYVKTDPVTGEKVYSPTNKMISKPKTLKDGTVVWKSKPAQTKTKRMYEAKDAYELVSDPNNPYPMERIYADYANQMKAMANEARLEALKIKTEPYDKTSASVYSKEVESINKKLQDRGSLKPADRMALRVATVHMKAVREENPNLSKEQYKKRSNQALATARVRCTPGGRKEKISLTEKEWEAIEAKAISDTKLKKLLEYTDKDQIREYTTPKKEKGDLFSAAQIARIKALKNSGYYTWADIAEEFGVSESTIKKYANQ